MKYFFGQGNKTGNSSEIYWSERNRLKIKTMKSEMQHSAPSGAVYAFGLIGAAIYYISTATGFWMGVLGFLKALVWPVFLVYEALKHLAM